VVNMGDNAEISDVFVLRHRCDKIIG
jgi:hypothetical protein